ncbi:MAG TPA: oligosaccharide flippase family protein [Terriglobales bacterium]|nr:oligosaccharide flippase family protein [Terriglobales bacterium]
MPALRLALKKLDTAATPQTLRPVSRQAIPDQTVRGGIFLAARYGLGVLVSLANMLVMTWWIGPHAYGLFVAAVGIVAFLATLARLGVDTYLVRSEAPTANDFGTATTLILAASVVLLGAGASVAPLLVRWFGNREFVWPYLALLLTIPVSGLTGVPMAQLERALDFGRIAVIELISQFAGLLTAVLMAWRHTGVWAPVLGQIAWQVFTLLAVVSIAPNPTRLRFERSQARTMLSYGLSLTTSLRTWQLRTLVNPLLVGRFAGPEGVAFVALAIRIAESLGTFRLAAGRIAVAGLARLQDHHEQFRNALEQALFLQVITLGPLLCGFALCGPFLLRHFAGPRWLPSLAVYPFVAAGVLVNSIYNLQASALFVIGEARVVTEAYTAHVVLLALTTLFLLPRAGIVGYGWAELVACASYGAIHAGLARSVFISYRRLVPWLATFAAVLFVSSISRTVGLLD